MPATKRQHVADCMTCGKHLFPESQDWLWTWQGRDAICVECASVAPQPVAVPTDSRVWPHYLTVGFDLVAILTILVGSWFLILHLLGVV